MQNNLELIKQNAIAFYRTAYLGDPAKAVEMYVGDELRLADRIDRQPLQAELILGRALDHPVLMTLGLFYEVPIDGWIKAGYPTVGQYQLAPVDAQEPSQWVTRRVIWRAEVVPLRKVSRRPDPGAAASSGSQISSRVLSPAAMAPITLEVVSV